MTCQNCGQEIHQTDCGLHLCPACPASEEQLAIEEMGLMLVDLNRELGTNSPAAQWGKVSQRSP